MAFAAQIIEQGSRNCIVKITGSATDTGTAFDGTTLPAPFTRVNINKTWSSIPTTGSVLVDWDATTDVRAITLNAGVAALDFQVFGGLRDDAGAGRTGSVIVTGTGTGDWTVVLWLVKH